MLRLVLRSALNFLYWLSSHYLCSPVLVCSDNDDMRMWLYWYPALDAVLKTQIGDILKQSRRQIMEPTISVLVIKQVWVRISGIKIRPTLSVVVNIIFTMLNIGWIFGPDTLLLRVYELDLLLWIKPLPLTADSLSFH